MNFSGMEHTWYDHIGNAIAESNTSGAITDFHQQDAWGRPVLTSYSGGWADNSLHQTTKNWDDGSEMYYFNARWYQAGEGLFMGEAPRDRAMEHPYGYAENNPISKYDFNGEYAWILIPLAISAAAGAYACRHAVGTAVYGPPPQPPVVVSQFPNIPINALVMINLCVTQCPPGDCRNAAIIIDSAGPGSHRAYTIYLNYKTQCSWP